MDKECTKCHVKKPLDLFDGHPKGRLGKHSKCKDCRAVEKKEYAINNKERMREYGKAYYQANKQKWVERDKRLREEDSEAFRQKSREAQARYRASSTNTIHLRYLKSRYGITIEQYAAMFDSQNGACAICRMKPDRIRLHVDHCHKTGVVRGLLCFKCNAILGHAQDNISVLDAAKEYLLAHGAEEHG